MNIRNKLANLEKRANDAVEKHFVAVLLTTVTLASALGIYGARKFDETYLHPKFCREYCWLKEKPRKEQIAYANKVSKVGEFDWGISEYIKEWSAGLWLEELDSCKCGQSSQ